MYYNVSLWRVRVTFVPLRLDLQPSTIANNFCRRLQWALRAVLRLNTTAKKTQGYFLSIVSMHAYIHAYIRQQYGMETQECDLLSTEIKTSHCLLPLGYPNSLTTGNCLLGYYAASRGNSRPTYWEKPIRRLVYGKFGRELPLLAA